MRSLIFIAALLAGTAQAGTGDFDPTFGTDGHAAVGFDLGTGDLSDRAKKVLPLAGGALLAVGQVNPFSNGYAQVGFLRLGNDGTPDPTFGNQGKVVQETAFQYIADAGLDGQGRIYVGGWYRDTNGNDLEFGVQRFLATGQPDITYGLFGLTVAAFDRGGTNEDRLNAMAVAPDGSVFGVGSVKIGTASDYDFGIVRWKPTGALDTGFSDDGLATVAFDLDGISNQDVATSISQFDPGTMRVGGYARRLDNSTVAAVASFVTANGAPAPAFCSGTTCQGSQGSLVPGPGKRTLQFDPTTTSNDYVSGVAIKTGTSGGMAVVGNTSLRSAPFSVRGAIAVMSASGLMPAIPGPTPGRAFFNLGDPTTATAVTHRFDDSHWIVTGAVGSTPAQFGYVAYVDETPALDSSFTRIGLGGPPAPSAYQLVEFPRETEGQPVETYVASVAIDSEQRIVGAGDRLWRRATNIEDDDFAVFRLDESDVIFRNGFENN